MRHIGDNAGIGPKRLGGPPHHMGAIGLGEGDGPIMRLEIGRGGAIGERRRAVIAQHGFEDLGPQAAGAGMHEDVHLAFAQSRRLDALGIEDVVEHGQFAEVVTIADAAERTAIKTGTEIGLIEDGEALRRPLKVEPVRDNIGRRKGDPAANIVADQTGMERVDAVDGDPYGPEAAGMQVGKGGDGGDATQLAEIFDLADGASIDPGGR